MNKSDMVELVKKIIMAMESEPGTKLTAAVKPITDLGMSSFDGIDFLVELEAQLGVELLTNQNPFVDDSGSPKARSIGEIADWALFQLANNVKDPTND